VVAALAALLVVTGGQALRAQETAAPAKHSDDPAAAEARHHYEEGTKAFNLGEFPRAIAEFKAAYNAKDDPSLLYNIAQSFRLQGDAAQAIFFYRSFLRNMPTAPNRKEVEGRIRTLEKQVDEQKKEAAGAPVPAPLPAPAVTVPPSVTPPVAITPAPAPVESTPSPAPKPEAAPPPVEPLPVAPAPVATAPAAPIVALTPAPADEPSPGKPIYKKWWFWTAIGVVAVLGVGAAAVAARDKPPSTSLGLYDPTFKP
jgi:tetratricopeptide (TPR) repeat protein